MFTALYYILWTLSVALVLSVLRIGQMAFHWPTRAPWSEAFLTIVNGYRMDLMIVGFWMIPVVLFMIVTELLGKRSERSNLLARAYFVLTWIFISVVMIKDLIFFPERKERLWLDDHLREPFIHWDFSQLPWWGYVVVFFVGLSFLKSGLSRTDGFFVRLPRFGRWGLLLVFVWTALIARGSLGQHHLRRADCQFSKTSNVVESLCLSPLFTFSKRK